MSATRISFEPATHLPNATRIALWEPAGYYPMTNPVGRLSHSEITSDDGQLWGRCGSRMPALATWRAQNPDYCVKFASAYTRVRRAIAYVRLAQWLDANPPEILEGDDLTEWRDVLLERRAGCFILSGQVTP